VPDSAPLEAYSYRHGKFLCGLKLGLRVKSPGVGLSHGAPVTGERILAQPRERSPFSQKNFTDGRGEKD